MLWLTLQRLHSGAPSKRRQAVERLARTESSRGLAALVEAVNDSDAEVRAAAVDALGGISQERYTDLFLRALQDPEPAVRRAAMTHIKTGGDEKVQAAVLVVLRDSDGGVRGRAARFLEQSGWRPSDLEEDVWLSIARGQMRRAAALGAVAIQPLESVFHGGSYSQQAAAVEALGTIPDERVLKSLLRALRSTDHVVCMAAIGALTNTGGSSVVNDLALMLRHQDHRIRSASIEAVARFDAQGHAGVFRELLEDPMWDVRCAAAGALSKVRDAVTVDALVVVLKDQVTDVRSAAAAALGRIGNARAIGPLALALTDGESDVRNTAAGALGMIDSKWAQTDAARKVAPDLRGALGSGDWAVRRAAAYVLEQIGERRAPSIEGTDTEMVTPGRRRRLGALTTFTDLLNDPDNDLRQVSAECLGRLGDARARSPLMTALTDKDQAVRLAAEHALAIISLE